MIKLINIFKKFGNDVVIDDLSLDIPSGETLVLLGASGSGKTTILKLINRLMVPTSGQIFIDGKNTDEFNPVALRRKIGYVFQNIALFPHLTIEENITIIPRLAGISKKDREVIARKLLEDLHLDPDIIAKRFPMELSGGQQQRVGVARALSMNPDYLLMDEPFGALDAITRYHLQNELLCIKQHIHKTIIFVTHDIFEAFRLGDRIAIMNKGKIEQVGRKIDIMRAPATPFVRELFDSAVKQFNEFTSLIHE